MKKFDNPMDFKGEPSYYVQILDNFTGEPTDWYCFAKKEVETNSYIEIFEKAKEMFGITKELPGTIYEGIPKIDIHTDICGIDYYKKIYIGFDKGSLYVVDEIMEQGTY